MTELLTATYTKSYSRVIVTFYENGEVEFSALGVDLTDEQVLEFAAAQGADVEGWEGSLS